MFDEVAMVKSYLEGNRIPERALDDCVYNIAKYCKEKDMDKIETKKVVINWLSDNGLHFIDINNNIDNAFKTKSKLKDGFCVYINDKDIDAINFSADFKSSKRVALFLLIYAKVHANRDGEFKIRIASMAKWLGIDRANLYKRNINPLVTYGFMEVIEKKSYSKFSSQKLDEKRSSIRINHQLENIGDFCISSNDDFESFFESIFIEGES